MTNTNTVEAVARMTAEEREQFVNQLVSKWPTMAQELQDAIGFELMTQEQYADYNGSYTHAA